MSRAKGLASARWWRKSPACAEPALQLKSLQPSTSTRCERPSLNLSVTVTLSAQTNPPALTRKPVFCFARHLRLRHHRRRIELVGDGRKALGDLLRRLEPKLEMVKRPGAVLTFDFGRFGLHPGRHFATRRKGRKRPGRRRLGSSRSALRRGRRGGIERHRLDRIPRKLLARLRRSRLRFRSVLRRTPLRRRDPKASGESRKVLPAASRRSQSKQTRSPAPAPVSAPPSLRRLLAITLSPASGLSVACVVRAPPLSSAKRTRKIPGIPSAPVRSARNASSAMKPATNARPIVRALRWEPTEPMVRSEKSAARSAGAAAQRSSSLAILLTKGRSPRATGCLGHHTMRTYRPADAVDSGEKTAVSGCGILGLMYP